MPRIVNCIHLKKEGEGLDYAPYPGDLGKRIYNEVSKEAWQMWLNWRRAACRLRPPLRIK